MENPQENSILERIHQLIANHVCMFDSQNNYLDEDDSWSGILAAIDSSVCRISHTKL